ncbi:MAG: NADH dehydrogenase (quinone) subunit D [Candidatus Melainabacteria bacterium GWF2_32_7]|nr:MAG: NADH dehydrogenase (quinone) subunit D [Candidatus Melainabacteria bacterium GWF2_32_7]
MQTQTPNQKMTINVGPQHPSTHGVLRLIMTLNGEIIEDTQPVIGYLHRGMEKIAESRTYHQYLPMVDRIDYLSSFFNLASFCYAVESIADIQVPKRAEYIRVITMEFNRIASHLMWLASFLLDLGATSPLFYAFREREEIVKLLEDLTGARMMYNFYSFGGVKKEFPSGWVRRALELCKKMPKYFDEYEAIVTKNPIILNRTKGVGILTPEMGLDYGITGPNIRASGIELDLRKTDPYSVYNDFDFKVCTAENGDSYDRYIVRIAEMRESVKIIEQAIAKLPGGSPSKLQVKQLNCGCNKDECCVCGTNTKLIGKKVNPIVFKPPAGEAISLIESPRGITTCYIMSDGTTKPYRVKWRTPSFSSVQVLPELIKGRMFADLMPIFGSLDVVLPEVDR